MPSIEQVANAIKTNREEFKSIFLQAQVGLSKERQPLGTITSSPADKQAFIDALNYAEANGFLEKLIDILIEDSSRNGDLIALIAKESGVAGNEYLHAMTNMARNFTIPDLIYGGIGNAMKWTGKLLIDGTPKGTGVLIGNNLFLTAWHVVRSLYRATPAGSWEPIPGDGKRITVEFEDLLSLLGRRNQLVQTKVFQAHTDWSVVFSPCLAEELADTLPDDLLKLDGYWDYAVIRLAKAPGLERRFVKIDDNAVVPGVRDKIMIFQHPAGQPLRFDDDEIAPIKPLNPNAIPKLRFLHYVNGVKGSSGGPCFDKSFVFFGLHQGEWIDKSTKAKKTNRGIPIVRIIEHIRKTIRELPVLDPSEIPIWRLKGSGFAPVLGLKAFQELVWQAASNSEPPQFIVTDGEKGKGKTFCGDLLHSMLADTSHLKIKLEAQTISKLPVEKLAEKIASMAGTKLDELDWSSFADSAPTVWIEKELLPNLLRKIEQVRQGRLVWISISELNKFDIEGSNSSTLLHFLYKEADTNNWLRFFLDGMKEDIPGVPDRLIRTVTLREIAKEDIESFLTHAVSDLELPVTQATIQVDTKEAYDDYLQWKADNRDTAEKKLAGKMERKIKNYWELLK